MNYRILIIQTASLGDVILSTALAETLHGEHPEAEIHFLVKKGYGQLFDGHPFVQVVHEWDKSSGKYRNLFRLIRAVRHNHYYAVINVQRFASAGLLTAFSGSKIRAGFHKNPFSLFFTRKCDHQISAIDSGIHEIERNHLLISDLVGCKTKLPRLYPVKTFRQDIAKQLKMPYVTVSPASLWFTKQYPEAQWIDFLNNIPSGLSVILLGSKSDETICQRIIEAANFEQAVNLSGKLNFLESAATMRGAIMNFVNDSAPQHLATAVNAPVTAIFCSTVPAFGFGPLSNESHIVETKLQLDCRPCGLHGYQACPLGHFECATTIKTEQLLNSLPQWTKR